MVLIYYCVKQLIVVILGLPHLLPRPILIITLLKAFYIFLLFATTTVSAQLHHQMLSSQGGTSKTNR
tara:strand:+ start:56 stop:256 length:201 start_codon:yes stop_codon:yes gene_type:complete